MVIKIFIKGTTNQIILSMTPENLLKRLSKTGELNLNAKDTYICSIQSKGDNLTEEFEVTK